MNSSFLLSVTTFIYGLAAFEYLVFFVFNKKGIGRFASWTALIGVFGNLAGFILRWVESYRLGIGHAPLSNLYESLVFFALTVVVVSLVVEYRQRNPMLGLFATPFAFLAMAYASLSPAINDRIQPLIPALKSNWLIAHVVTCFIGYAAFAVACGIGLMYLIKRRDSDNASSLLSLFPPLAALDELILQLVKFGFLFLTVGIITGAVWANSAWGRYWGWDPKETWSLITWLIYATMLHFRVFLSWRGKIFAIFCIIGFLAVLFTYFGVNYLPGLHSYGVIG
ncbi:MAG: c-type cytochrome biogenesis protein CcsB [Desulfobacterales bacterium]|jgi:cytochrome c-type biogenesis protein CcsB|nr:c-type cytochrome biogenesis protein CcsB [Desulfobacterales bacterium]